MTKLLGTVAAFSALTWTVGAYGLPPSVSGSSVVVGSDPTAVGAGAPSVHGFAGSYAPLATASTSRPLLGPLSVGVAGASDVSGRLSLLSSNLRLRPPPILGVNLQASGGYAVFLNGGSLWTDLSLDWRLGHLWLGSRLHLSEHVDEVAGLPQLTSTSFVHYSQQRWDVGLEHLEQWRLFSSRGVPSRYLMADAGVRPVDGGPSIRASSLLDLRTFRASSRIGTFGAF